MSKKIMGVTVGTPIRPSKFATELADRVEEMVKANTEQEKTVDITENGTVEIVPDTGYKLTKVTANVNVAASGENKLAQILEGTATEITAEDLEGITNIKQYLFHEERTLTSIVMPNTITNIGDYAFYRAQSLITCVLSNSITSIGTYCFSACIKLENIVLPNSITKIGNKIFGDCTSLQSVILPENSEFTTLPSQMFTNCYNLSNVVMSNNIKIIGYGAFQNCSLLKNITLSNTLTTIDSSAFSYSGLTDITFPSTLTTIGTLAFEDSSSTTRKTTYTFLGTTPPSIQSNTFTIARINKIIVPKGCGEAYKTATNWANFADFIEEATE